jgi:hypothetical protein
MRQSCRLHGATQTCVKRLGRPAAAGILLVLSGCAMAPDTLCQTRRPAWSLNDTRSTIATQSAAAARWDSHCTLMGAFRR